MPKKPSSSRTLVKFLLFLVAIPLLLLIPAFALAIYDIFPDLTRAEFPWLAPEPLALLAGYTAWTVVFLIFPPSFSVYVLGHELTHAIWGFFTGSKVGKIKVSSNGGYVMLTNPGLFTTLAPYFVPFYTIITVLLKLGISLFFDQTPYTNIWLAVFGATYGFHITYTIKSLSVEQPDIKEYGFIFSYALIILINVFILGFGLSCVTQVRLIDYFAALAMRVMSIPEVLRLNFA